MSNANAESTVPGLVPLHPAAVAKPPEAAPAVVRPPTLSVRNLSKAFGSTQALWPLDLDIRAGEIHALLGENGSGKSTFIKSLSGYHTADTGRVEVCGEVLSLGSVKSAHDLGCRFVHQDLGLIGTETVLDNLCAGGSYRTVFGTISGRANRRAAVADLARAGVAIDPMRRLSTLSPAEQTAVAVARALRSDDGAEPKLLVLDEPTARLPQKEVAQLLDTVRAVAQAGVAVIYVSHRIDEVLEVADTATVLRDGHKVATRDVKELDRRALVDLLVGDALDDVDVSSHVAPAADAPVLFSVESLSSVELDDVSFAVKRGEVVGIAGITGSGRESILATVFGELPRVAGSVRVSDTGIAAERPDLSIRAGVGYVPPDRKIRGSIAGFSARENLVLVDLTRHWKFPKIGRRGEHAEVMGWFERFSVRPGDDVDRPLSAFSGGNQQKILFGKWLRTNPRVLLLDEPTQGVDIATKAELHKQILAAADDGACAVISSSDTDELISVCHRVLVMRHGRIVETLTGKDKTVANLSHAAFGTAEEGGK
ncbi:sugar ABC transporter ATP-binding protein [Amycolatopsis sp. FDAARGOS 1241]|uniref:sugar ABC transporter ATP-binding protein n=1 Tax=Amycolatopsis sp. FDAARGOS 1241 TaxID=2778070 RepID=UPI00194FBEFC|nr:sugar ABC transporter ATP-binding protein [Amycolatopsis sp. FDAARGOS 1241]QRP42860.1 sugar ABC transporter ATP-binding protein [Amycolatopsis sp. FDAARGOS 1241]